MGVIKKAQSVDEAGLGYILSLNRNDNFKLNIKPLRRSSFLISKMETTFISQGICEDPNNLINVTSTISGSIQLTVECCFLLAPLRDAM